MCGTVGKLRREHPQTFSSYNLEPGFVIQAHGLNTEEIANFQQEPMVSGKRLLIEFTLQMSMTQVEGAVAHFYSVTNIIIRLNCLLLLHQPHQVLKSVLQVRKH